MLQGIVDEERASATSSILLEGIRATQVRCSLLQLLAYLSDGSLNSFTLCTLRGQLHSHCRPLLGITLYADLHTDRHGGWQHASLHSLFISTALTLLLQCTAVSVYPDMLCTRASCSKCLQQHSGIIYVCKVQHCMLARAPGAIGLRQVATHSTSPGFQARTRTVRCRRGDMMGKGQTEAERRYICAWRGAGGKGGWGVLTIWLGAHRGMISMSPSW